MEIHYAVYLKLFVLFSISSSIPFEASCSTKKTCNKETIWTLTFTNRAVIEIKKKRLEKN